MKLTFRLDAAAALCLCVRIHLLDLTPAWSLEPTKRRHTSRSEWKRRQRKRRAQQQWNQPWTPNIDNNNGDSNGIPVVTINKFLDCRRRGLTTCSPTVAPTAIDLTSMSVSISPSESSTETLPTASPSGSFMPSDMPSLQPSLYPSDIPSQAPSLSPAPTSMPSQSPTATTFPSDSPSSRPTREPSERPSKQPTTTTPTSVPRDYVSTVKVEEGIPQSISTCRRDVPEGAIDVQDQLVTFLYVVNLERGSDFNMANSALGLRLHKDLTALYLHCSYEDHADESFHTYAVSSLPLDSIATGECSISERLEDADCYKVNGAFTSTIFYSDHSQPEDLNATITTQSRHDIDESPDHSRRQLAASTITDENVLISYSQSLKKIFEHGSLTGPIVLETTLLAITNDAVPRPAPVIHNGQNSKAPIIAGGVIGGLALIILIVTVFLLKRERGVDQNKKNAAGDTSSTSSDAQMEKTLLTAENTSFRAEQARQATLFNDDDDDASSVSAGRLAPHRSFTSWIGMNEEKDTGIETTFVKPNIAHIASRVKTTPERAVAEEPPMAEIGSEEDSIPSNARRDFAVRDTVAL